MSDPDDDGTITVMLLGFLVLVLLVVALVVDSSSYFLARRDAQAVCDRLALYSARDGNVLGYYGGGVSAGGRQELASGSASAEIAALQRARPDVVTTGPVYGRDASGRQTTATWTCELHAHPPFTGAFSDDGLPVQAAATAVLSGPTAGG